MTFEEFEIRCQNEKDLELNCWYWNHLLPDTAPFYFSWMILLFILELEKNAS